MPRYFFHLEGSERIQDKRGQILPNDDAARREAEAIARALRKRSGNTWRVTVTYGNGEDITEALLVLGIKYQVQRLKKSVDAPCFSSAF